MTKGQSKKTATRKANTEHFGDVFRTAREARGIALDAITESTKISKAALEALERDDIDRLPGGIFTRSFVRSYAEAVGLDPDATLRDFLERFPARSDGEPALGGDSRSHDEFRSQQQMARTVLTLTVLSLVLVVGLVVMGMRDAGGDAAAPPAPSQADVPGPTRAPSSPPPVVFPPPVSLPAPAPVAVGPLTIDIHPRGDCWVSATVDGETRFARIMQAGEREVLEAEREVVVSIGDAGTFAFAINQRPGRSLGAPGEVVTARINRDNFRSYLVE